MVGHQHVVVLFAPQNVYAAYASWNLDRVGPGRSPSKIVGAMSASRSTARESKLPDQRPNCSCEHALPPWTHMSRSAVYLAQLLASWDYSTRKNVSRAILEVDIGVYIGTVLWPLQNSSYRIHVLLAYQ